MNVARAEPRESLGMLCQQCRASMVLTGLCAGTLAPGLRKAPDYAPGRLGGWVTSCGWRRPSRPRGEALTMLPNRAGSARVPPSRGGGARSRHSVNLSLAACASRALRFKSNTTLNNGYLGSRNDEERSEMRYLV